MPEVSELHRYVVPKYAARWRDLGQLLELPEHYLNAIAQDNLYHPLCNERCCKSVLKKWMEITPDATWNSLQMAIDFLSDSSYYGMCVTSEVYNYVCTRICMHVHIRMYTDIIKGTYVHVYTGSYVHTGRYT